MEQIGLGEHVKNIQSHRISGKELTKLQQDDLEEVCVVSVCSVVWEGSMYVMWERCIVGMFHNQGKLL